MTTEQVEHASTVVLNKFSTLPFDEIKYLHTFYPITGKHEFDTLLLVNWLREKHPRIRLVLSRSNFETHTLEHIIWEDATTLVMNRWGITEPQDGVTVEPDMIDLIVIPLLAFDTKGNRIGYGKGFYDRFLAECRPDAVKTGISFFPPEEQFSEVDRFDIPLDLCITPEKIWKF